jgi:uncharacterized protein YkwD
MTSAGFDFTGAWASAENIGWVSTRDPAGLQDEVQLLHTNLMNSPDHRANLLGRWSRVGVGIVHVTNPGGYYRAYSDVTIIAAEFGRRT